MEKALQAVLEERGEEYTALLSAASSGDIDDAA
jgi:hypothetical protein